MMKYKNLKQRTEAKSLSWNKQMTYSEIRNPYCFQGVSRKSEIRNQNG